MHRHGLSPFKTVSMSVLPLKILEQFAPQPEGDFSAEIAHLLQQKNAVVVVVDDDPTGAQYAGVPLITEWSRQSILNELQNDTKLFFILTNSRSLPVEEAIAINLEAGKNIREAFAQTNKHPITISRSDSTLRGHHPHEVEALAEGLQMNDFKTAIIPAYIEAGRFTIADVQYVQEDEQLIPAHQTPFANDKAFGYKAENLKQWVSEKSSGKIPSESVESFSINDLRSNNNLSAKLKGLPTGSTFIVNAASPVDLQLFVRAWLQADVPVVFRSGPSLVAAFGSFDAAPMLPANQVVSANAKYGGLIIVGSYVPQSSRQLQKLLQTGIQSIEINVNDMLSKSASEQVELYAQKIEHLLRQQKDVVVYTSRLLVHGSNAGESLLIGNQVSAFLVQLVRQLSVQPKYLIAKGGITSHDIAVKGLGIKRAVVKGRVAKGIPVWQTGSECLFPQMPYMVFPGNVGDDNSLAALYENLSSAEFENQLH